MKASPLSKLMRSLAAGVAVASGVLLPLTASGALTIEGPHQTPLPDPDVRDSVTVDPTGGQQAAADSMDAQLSVEPVTARDLKTLQYMENAHGQLEEWTSRLFARLKRDLGPRQGEPVLDGRADLQVQKISVTYAGYTHNDALARLLRELADAEQRRVDTVRRMIREGPDEAAWAAADAPVQQIVKFIRDWSERS